MTDFIAFSPFFKKKKKKRILYCNRCYARPSHVQSASREALCVCSEDDEADERQKSNDETCFSDPQSYS